MASGIRVRNWSRLDGAQLTAYVFVAPYLIMFALFRLWPLLSGFFVSFNEWAIIGEPTFIGLRNYADLFSDEKFLQSMKNTAYFTALTVPPLIVFGLLLATALNRNLFGKTFFKICFFIPYVLAVASVAITWKWMYTPLRFGILNHYVGLLGIPPVDWLGTGVIAMPAVAATTVWWVIGFEIVVFIAALQDIPDELYEAAAIEGATNTQSFLRITLPLLTRVILLVSVLQFIGSFQVFGQVYILTNGGPYGSTRVLVHFVYENAFKFWRMGYASAAAYVLFVIIFLISTVQFRLLRSEAHY
jgi:multiple sugar transport system permease protein